jgi:hypothetical protein
MIVITVVAILLGLSVTLGGILVPLFAFVTWCVLPVPLVICAIFGRGDLRAFAIGGLVPWFLMSGDRFPSPLLWLPVWLLVTLIVCGTIGVLTHRCLQRWQ